MTSISALWTTLDTDIQQWLLHNPGTTFLPRTYVNQAQTGTGRTLSLNEHGEHRLSPEEMLFLKVKRGEVLTARSTT
ncbi:hypothetical protein [Arthrobacter sp. B0490]|uniref:hypothetical protein n=1 Tax=Arthrobacter sp. B0490 TaxID=2058891 RepID=UPI000CE2E5D6|nr:hypothetical protein [Arthrobacter sp. B0490]